MGHYSQGPREPRKMCEQWRGTVSKDSSRVSLVTGDREPGEEARVPEEERGGLSQARKAVTKVDQGGD